MAFSLLVSVRSEGRTAKRAAELHAHSAVIISGPSVIHAGVDDGQRPRHHGRAKLGVADAVGRLWAILWLCWPPEMSRNAVFSGVSEVGHLD
jgi:hypothetical protein